MSQNEKGLGGKPETLNETSAPLDKQNPELTQGEINWRGDPRIILNDQAGTAAYTDTNGELVITQRDTLGSEGTIFIAPESVKTFAQAISRLAGETSAARTRRYRERKCAAVTQCDANVTALRIVKASS